MCTNRVTRTLPHITEKSHQEASLLSMVRKKWIHISEISIAFEGCRQRGIDPGDIFESIGLPPALLSDPDGLFPVDKLADLRKAAFSRLHDESFGWLERPTEPGTTEMIMSACINCRSLDLAISRWAKYWRIIHKDFRIGLETHGDEGLLTVEYSGESKCVTTIVNNVLLFTLRWANWMIDKTILLDRVLFQFPEPENAGDYGDFYPCRHYFAQSRSALVFHHRFLTMPIAQKPENIPDFIRLLPSIMTVSRVDKSISGQVRRLLQITDEFEAMSLNHVAEKLHKSPDTVRRLLRQEGSSFMEIKQSVLRDVAIYHLRRSDLAINQIALMVGFSESSAFNRAFKRWTGETPTEFRNQT